MTESRLERSIANGWARLRRSIKNADHIATQTIVDGCDRITQRLDTIPMTENRRLTIEPYAGGFIIADYTDEASPGFYGRDRERHAQPIVHNPFPTQIDAQADIDAFFNGEWVM